LVLIAVFLVFGVAALVAGGEALVRGAVGVAERFRVPPMIIWLTLVGFGTSTPELATSVQAALADAPAIALGNVIGSNIANILLILGLSALIHPIPSARGALYWDGSAILISAVMLSAAVFTIGLTPLTAAGLLTGLGVYLAVTLYRARTAPHAAEQVLHASEAEMAPKAMGLLASTALLALGLALVMAGASLFVEGAVRLASSLGLSEALIGLTVVAVGTSLPELATSVVAAARGRTDIALGNIIGSNIFNTFAIAGTASAVTALPEAREAFGADAGVMLAATLALLAFAFTGRRIARWEGAVLLAAFVTYLAVRIAL